MKFYTSLFVALLFGIQINGKFIGEIEEQPVRVHEIQELNKKKLSWWRMLFTACCRPEGYNKHSDKKDRDKDQELGTIFELKQK